MEHKYKIDLEKRIWAVHKNKNKNDLVAYNKRLNYFLYPKRMF